MRQPGNQIGSTYQNRNDKRRLLYSSVPLSFLPLQEAVNFLFHLRRDIAVGKPDLAEGDGLFHALGHVPARRPAEGRFQLAAVQLQEVGLVRGIGLGLILPGGVAAQARQNRSTSVPVVTQSQSSGPTL